MRNVLVRSMLPTLLVGLVAALFAAPCARAEDLLDDEETPSKPSKPSAPPTSGDLLDEDLEPTPEGDQDSAAIYKAQLDAVRNLDADEELMAWEEYLAKYPSSTFKDRIEKRMELLSDSLYGERIPTEGGEGGEGGRDGDAQEIYFSQGLLIENMNPRERLQFAFEWGLPNYMNLQADYERPISRELSFHGGVRRRYSGWSAEGGVRYALIKSSRTQTIVTVSADVRANLDPFFFGFRPMIAGGKRLMIGERALDLQGQVGPDLDLRKDAGFPLFGGVNATFYAAPTVAIFLESTVNQKWAGDYSFRFNVVSFGIKFFPGEVKGKWEANVGASAPAVTNYWAHHYGAIMGQANLYLDQ